MPQRTNEPMTGYFIFTPLVDPRTGTTTWVTWDQEHFPTTQAARASARDMSFRRYLIVKRTEQVVYVHDAEPTEVA